jgi:hypothetical protein
MVMKLINARNYKIIKYSIYILFLCINSINLILVAMDSCVTDSLIYKVIGIILLLIVAIFQSILLLYERRLRHNKDDADNN